MPFVPAAADRAAPTPVLATGGIAEGRGLAAALVFGAFGAMPETRFLATQKASIETWRARAIMDGHGVDTEQSGVTDLVKTGRPIGRHAPCAAASWSSGGASRRSLKATTAPLKPIKMRSSMATVHSPLCGRARPSSW